MRQVTPDFELISLIDNFASTRLASRVNCKVLNERHLTRVEITPVERAAESWEHSHATFTKLFCMKSTEVMQAVKRRYHRQQINELDSTQREFFSSTKAINNFMQLIYDTFSYESNIKLNEKCALKWEIWEQTFPSFFLLRLRILLEKKGNVAHV